MLQHEINEVGSGEVRRSTESPSMIGPVAPDICAALQELGVRRKFCISLANKQTNAAKALVRRYCGFRWDVTEAERTKVNARAARIVEHCLAGKPNHKDDSEIVAIIGADMEMLGQTLAPLLARRHLIELEMKRAARTMPVSAWTAGVKGLGELGLAVIVAESGDIGNYPHARKLWKRLGLAPLDGRAMSQWRIKGGLTADEWTAAGYAPRRRAEIHACVGEPLLRAQGTDGPYRAVYDARRAKTAVDNAEWTKGHSHADGMRIMTKELISDLWSAWRGSVTLVKASKALARAHSIHPGADEASEQLPV